jgi:hypothetical protein
MRLETLTNQIPKKGKNKAKIPKNPKKIQRKIFKAIQTKNQSKTLKKSLKIP